MMEPEELVEYTPEPLQVEPGTLIIFDQEAFLSATKSLAIHLTEEGSVFLMDESGEYWKSLPVITGKKIPTPIRPA